MKKISNSLYLACECAAKNPDFSIVEIAENFKVDRHSVTKHFYDYVNYKYLHDNERYWITKEEMAPVTYILENANASLASVAKKFGTKPDTIKRRLSVIGETYKVRHKRKYNRQAFSSLDTEQQAYWLGFILADGYINSERGFLKIKLAQRDEKHLEKFANFMQEENIAAIKHDVGGAYTRDNICSYIEFDSKDLVKDLNKYNLFQGKSGKEKPIEMPNLNMTISYIRGMIDGDGHVEDGYFKYVGSKQSCEYMKKVFSNWYQFKENSKYIYEHGTIYSFEIRNKEVNKILHIIYDNATVYLDRKYQTIQKI